MVTNCRLVHRMVVSWQVHLSGQTLAAAATFAETMVIHNRATNMVAIEHRVTPIFLVLSLNHFVTQFLSSTLASTQHCHSEASTVHNRKRIRG